MNNVSANDQLRAAFKAGDSAGVVAAFSAGADPNIGQSKKENNTRTLFLEAIERKNTSMALLFLEAGANVEGFLFTEIDAIPWKQALKQGMFPLFMAMWKKYPSLGNPELSPENSPLSSPWGQVAFNASARPIFHAFIESAHQHGHRLPPSLAQIIALKVSEWENPNLTLDNLLLLVENRQEFLEDVAKGACAIGALGKTSEKKARASRTWALKNGATFMSDTLDSRRKTNRVPMASKKMMACQLLLHAPLSSPAGFNEWFERWGRLASPKTVDAMVEASLSLMSPKALWGIRDSGIPWSLREKEDPATPGLPLPHHAVQNFFRPEYTGAIGLLRTVIATGHELHTFNERGNTALHELFNHHAQAQPSLENTRRLHHAVKLFHRAGLTLAAVNRAGISVASLAKTQGQSAAIEMVSRWESSQLDTMMPAVSAVRTNRARL